jgi:hypothetical protein
MLVGISLVNDNYEYVTGITWNTTEDLEHVVSIATVDDSRIEIWKLVAPSSGTHNVVVSFDQIIPSARSAWASVITFTGVDQSTPLGDPASDTGTTEPVTVNVTSATGDLVFGVAAAEYDSITNDDGSQTEHWNEYNVSSAGAAVTEDSAATVTISWNDTTSTGISHWSIGAVSIKPSWGGVRCLGDPER